jgi:hypothetical protein
LLVVADTPQEAFQEVASKLSDEPKWSDWNSAGEKPMDFAGRWSGEIFGTIDEDGKMSNTDTNPNYLRYSLDLTTYTYDPYASKLDMDLWATKKLAQLLSDEWTPDSGVYDLEWWTGSLDPFTKRVGLEPTKQFLIPVDFHF